MRRTMLLLSAVAVALLIASGVALAVTKQCVPGRVCNGTAGGDQITGTNQADTINGGGGSDRIYALGGPDRVNGGPGQDDDLYGGLGDDTLNDYSDGYGDFYGEQGNDTLNGGPSGDNMYGGPGNDRVNGAAGYDTFEFERGWGADTLTDIEDVRADSDDLSMRNLTWRLEISAQPEVTDGTNRLNWSTDTLVGVIGGTANDRFVMSSSGDNIDDPRGDDTYLVVSPSKGIDSIGDDAGNDTYSGVRPGSGALFIQDDGGTSDSLDLTNFNLSQLEFSYDADGGRVSSLRIVEPQSLDPQLLIQGYAKGPANNPCAVTPDRGLIESIAFADDPNVPFSQVKTLAGCDS